jgi:hypothetical protein
MDEFSEINVFLLIKEGEANGEELSTDHLQCSNNFQQSSGKIEREKLNSIALRRSAFERLERFYRLNNLPDVRFTPASFR